MKKYRKLPVVVEAMQYTGKITLELHQAIENSDRNILLTGSKLCIRTLEGVMRANKGDYIIRGVNGELYPCKPDVFHKTYEEVE